MSIYAWSVTIGSLEEVVVVEVDVVVLVVLVVDVVVVDDVKEVSDPVVLDSIVDESDVVELTPVTGLELPVVEELAVTLAGAARLEVVVIVLVMDIVVVKVCDTAIRVGRTDWQSVSD